MNTNTELMDKFVHSNPWSDIGGAVAAGAAIAMLLGMRKRRQAGP